MRLSYHLHLLGDFMLWDYQRLAQDASTAWIIVSCVLYGKHRARMNRMNPFTS
jgi:hypothetical protein